MRKRALGRLTLLAGAIVATSCASTTEEGMPGLYKNEAARELCHASYDRALELAGVELEDRWVETSFGRSHLVTAGPADARPLVLLPGLYADATMWYPNLRALAERHRVFALDMINYGGKSEPAGAPIAAPEDYARWYAELLAGLGLERAPLAGLSYGSWTALTIARHRPDLVSALVLLDPSESFMPMDGGIAWRGFWSFMVFPSRAKYTEFFQWMGGGYTDPEMEIWFEHLLDVIEHGTATMAKMPRKLYAPEELEAVDMPVLVLAGGKPILYKDPGAFAAAARKALPRAEVSIVPEAGHGLNMEKPGLVNEAMLSFLGDGEGRP